MNSPIFNLSAPLDFSFAIDAGLTPQFKVEKIKYGDDDMFSSIIVLLYNLVSLIGITVLLFGKENDVLKGYLAKFAVLFFTACHLLFLILAIIKWFIPVPNLLMIFAVLLTLSSRILNGRFIFGKNHWQHYFITGSLMTAVLLLNQFNL